MHLHSWQQITISGNVFPQYPVCMHHVQNSLMMWTLNQNGIVCHPLALQVITQYQVKEYTFQILSPVARWVVFWTNLLVTMKIPCVNCLRRTMVLLKQLIHLVIQLSIQTQEMRLTCASHPLNPFQEQERTPLHNEDITVVLINQRCHHRLHCHFGLAGLMNCMIHTHFLGELQVLSYL